MTTCPPDFTGFVLDILHHLHQRGVIRDPDQDQQTPPRGEELLPASFLGGMEDQPDHAITIIGPYNQSQDSLTNPILEFTIGIRTNPFDFDQLTITAQQVRTALHHPTRAGLTAAQSVMYCERVRVDAPMRDANDRWLMAHTYQARPFNPTI